MSHHICFHLSATNSSLTLALVKRQKRHIRKVKSLVMGPVASEKEHRLTSRDIDLKAAQLPEGYI